ncbi:RecX family transcriptional regulator, partial [Mycobacterium tuberculosis]|nr:RecX family transcriptional regulator [Mycobacterium tuberculosis]
MLTRRLADKAARRWPDSEPEARRAAVAAAVAYCVAHGLVDDARFADLSIRGGAARGHSRRRIAVTLRERGVAGAADLAAVDDLAGALRLLRRRRLGPWATTEAGTD